MVISHSLLLRMRNVSNRSYRENQNTHFMFNNIFPKKVPFMSNVNKYCTAALDTGDNIIRRMRFVCWINKATNVRGGADASLARTTSPCRSTELTVSLERRVCSCAELQVFSCYRD